MPYTPILGTLGYLLSADGKDVLLIHRNARPEDDHLGKYNGLGGKIEPNENVWQGMVREIKEEANVEVTKMTLRGTINWRGFGKRSENWLGFIFLITEFKGTPINDNPEGNLSWQPISEMQRLPMWEGDRHFLPMVFDKVPHLFHGLMIYEKDRLTDWHFDR